MQVRGAQKVGTAQPILSCPILFLSAAGIDPCWFWHSRAKATRGQRLVLLGAAARGTDVLLSTCLLLRHHAVIPVWFQSLLGCVYVWCVSARSRHTDQRVFPIVIFWEREKRKGMSEVEVCTRGSWILVNVTLCGQVQVTVNRQGQANVVLCSLVPSLLKILYAANLSCVFVLGFCFS